mgnify:CR=1 FL=1
MMRTACEQMKKMNSNNAQAVAYMLLLEECLQEIDTLQDFVNICESNLNLTDRLNTIYEVKEACKIIKDKIKEIK